MKQMNRSIQIHAPVSKVFAYLEQPESWLAVMPSLMEVSNIQPAANGAKSFDWVYKMLGHRFHGKADPVKYVPNQYLELHLTGGIDSTFRWTFEGGQNGITTLKVDMDYTIPAPVLGKVAEVIAHRMNERELDTTLFNINEVLQEGQHQVPAGAKPQRPSKRH